MKRALTKLTKNGPREYSLADICHEEFLPWVRDPRTLRKMIAEDKKGANILRAKVSGTGGQKRYTIDSTDLMVYLTTYGPAFAHKTRKQKTR